MGETKEVYHGGGLSRVAVTVTFGARSVVTITLCFGIFIAINLETWSFYQDIENPHSGKVKRGTYQE
jgi:hypothetical protein